MTMTQNETRIPGPTIPVGQAIGQVVGQAQSVLSGLLVDGCSQAGTDERDLPGPAANGAARRRGRRDRYVGDLVDWLDLDRRDAGELADSLVAAGLLTDGDRTVAIADAGAQLRASIVGSISAVTAPMYESLEPGRRRDDRPHPARPHPAGAGAEPGAPADPAEGRENAHDHAEPARRATRPGTGPATRT